MFKGTLSKGTKTCGECRCCDEYREIRWTNGHREEIIHYKCNGVAEPFTINTDFKSVNEIECTEYPDTNLKETKFNSLEEFVLLLNDREKKELKKLLG